MLRMESLGCWQLSFIITSQGSDPPSRQLAWGRFPSVCDLLSLVIPLKYTLTDTKCSDIQRFLWAIRTLCPWDSGEFGPLGPELRFPEPHSLLACASPLEDDILQGSEVKAEITAFLGP